MKYIKFTYVDKRTGKSITEEPCKNGPTHPDVTDLTYELALKSNWPVIGNNNYPLFFGTCPDSSNTNKPGVLEELTETEYNQIKDDELVVRKKLKRRRVDEVRDRELKRKGKMYNFPDGTSGTIQLRNLQDKTNIQGLGSNGLKLKVSGDTTTTVPFRDMENQQHNMNSDELIAMGESVSNFIQEHYSAAWNHKSNIEACTTLDEIENYDISANWPEN